MNRRSHGHAPTCTLAGDFLGGEDAVRLEFDLVPPDLRAHAALCPACGDALHGYFDAVDAFAAATREAIPALPSFDRIGGRVGQDELVAARRRRAWGRGLGALVPVAAAAALALLLWPTTDVLVPPAAHPPTAAAPLDAPRVVRAVGVVSVDSGEGWNPLLPQQSLPEGSDVETGVDAEAQVASAGVARVTLASRTRVRLARWRSAEVDIALSQGSVTATVEPRAAGERFVIRTPLALVTVVGTEFTTAHSPEDGTVVSTRAGRVRVERLDGTLVALVDPGESVTVAPSATDGVIRAGRPPVPPPSPSPAASSPGPGTPDALAPGASAVSTLEDTSTVDDGAVDEGTASAPSPAPRRPAARDPVEEALDLLARGENEAAAQLLEKAGRSPRSLSLLGDAYRLSGRADDATAAYEAALVAAGRRDLGPVVLDLTELLVANGEPDAAVFQWRRYLDRHPQGRAAATVRWRLADHLRKAGQDEAAAEQWALLLSHHPDSARAPEALARLGQRLLDAEAWSAAARLFGRSIDSPHARTAETALVGLIHARAGQGRRDEVARLADEYRERFPDGRRAAEVRRLLERLGDE